MNVSVIGLGKLGAPLAAVLASKGHRVTGVDLDAQLVERLNEGRSPHYEPGLAELLDAHRQRFEATTDTAAAIRQSEVSFIIVPTPSNDRGTFSLRYVLPAMEAIGTALRHKDAYHLVVLTSTVMPGDTGGEVLPVLERSSGKRCGQGFGLCYNPEFVALGAVIRGLLEPDFILIGESDRQAGERLAGVYEGLCESRPPVARMGFIDAEVAKLAVNTYITTRISFANMLAQICSRLPGADVDQVTGALGLDSRIGPKYLKGALGYGGPCFPRDNLALATLARGLGTEPLIAEATDRFNRRQVDELRSQVEEHLPSGGLVALLGLSYKPDTDVIEQSQGLELARQLLASGVRVMLYDPAAMDPARRVLPASARWARSPSEATGDADVVVIATPWDEFRDLDAGDLASGRSVTLIDGWRIVDRERFSGIRYIAPGLGPSAVDAAQQQTREDVA